MNVEREQEKFYIGTTRFTNKTFQENKEWREKHNWKGCIYGLNKRISHSRNHCIPKEALICVIEMNNDTNKIEGIGLIRNYINYKYKAEIYKSCRDCNRYIYNSEHRIDIKDIKYKKMILLMENILFYGSDHYKRGRGITNLSWNKFNESTAKIIRLFFVKLFKLE